MMTFNFKREWISLTAIAITALLSVIFYPMLPDMIPIHWGLSGQPDNFAPKLQALVLMPLGALLLYGILYAAPLLDPKRASLERSAETYILIRNVVLVFFMFMHGLTLYTTLQDNQTLTPGFITLGVGLLFMVLGNYMPRMKPSWIAGIRTPWTLSNDRVWTKTHRLGGRTFVVGGLLVCLTAFLPPAVSAVVTLVAVLTAALIPVLYSYWLWRHETSRT